MSLARIITSTPDRFSALADYLRSLGYTVETLDPAAARIAPADLELDVEGCSAEEAMARASQAADAPNPGRRAIAFDITGRPVAFADDEDEAPEAARSHSIIQTWNGIRSALREMAESVRLSAGRLGEWFAEGRETLREHRTRAQEAHRRAADWKRRAREAKMVARQEELRSRQEEDALREQERARAQERLVQEKEQQRRQELTERERRLIERYRREARRDVVEERFESEQRKAAQSNAPAEATLAQREIRRPVPRRSARDGDWSKAAAVAVGLASLVTATYAIYANRHPAAPLSNRALVRSQSVSQSVPFGAATAPPQAQDPVKDARQDGANRKLPQGDVAPPAKPSVPQASHTQKRRRATRSPDDTVADDQVIVYRNGTSQSRIAAGGNASGPKHISDLEQ